MRTPLFIATAAPLLALAACNNKPTEVLDTNPDPMATELKNAAPVELPPAITADKTFRCKDNSLVYVTFFEGNKQANIRSVRDGPATMVKAEQAGEPMIAEGGWKLTGDPQNITITQPDKGTLTCRSS